MADETIQSKTGQQVRELERRASQPQPGMVAEFVAFFLQNKKWWLAPIVVFLAIVGVLIVLASSGAAPFIYTLF